MRFALAAVLGLGLVAGQVLAQEHTRIVDLAQKLAESTEQLKLEQTAPTGKPRKIGERILRNILTDGAEDRARNDPIFERFDIAAEDLARAARDLDHPDSRRSDERAFIRQFREVERIAMDVDRTLTRPAARSIMHNDVKPSLVGIRREVRSLSAWRDDGRRDFYRRDSDRL